MKRGAQRISSDEEVPEKKKQRVERPVARPTSRRHDWIEADRGAHLKQERTEIVKRIDQDRKKREGVEKVEERTSRKVVGTEYHELDTQRENDELEKARRYRSRQEVEGQTQVRQDHDSDVIEVSEAFNTSSRQVESTSLRMTRRTMTTVTMRLWKSVVL